MQTVVARVTGAEVPEVPREVIRRALFPIHDAQEC